MHRITLKSCDAETMAFMPLTPEELRVLNRVVRVLDKNRGEGDCYPEMNLMEVRHVPGHYALDEDGDYVPRDV